MTERKLTFIERVHTRLLGNGSNSRDRRAAINFDQAAKTELEVSGIGYIDDLRRDFINSAVRQAVESAAKLS